MTARHTRLQPARRQALRKIGSLAAAALAPLPLLGLAAAAHAQAPTVSSGAPLRMVVPFPPGGGTDILARLLADRLRPLLQQNIIIDNKPGATGNIGNDLVAKATPDGNTVLIQGTVIGSFPHLFAKLSYDPLKDLQAVGTVAESPNVLVVPTTSPLRQLSDLVKAAKEDPNKPLNYGTAGIASPQHLAMEQWARLAGIRLQHISYRGTAPAVNDVIGGQTNFGAFSLSSMLSLIQGGKVRVLAVLTDRRSTLLPDVPSISELGYKGVESSIRFALFLPAAAPAAVVDRLAAANARAIADPSLREAFQKAGYEIVTATPAETAAMVQREYTQWGPVVQQLGLKPE
jgi:tripartite-type tricarboxylate transporter receptor subunit TctC